MYTFELFCGRGAGWRVTLDTSSLCRWSAVLCLESDRLGLHSEFSACVNMHSCRVAMALQREKKLGPRAMSMKQDAVLENVRATLSMVDDYNARTSNRGNYIDDGNADQQELEYMQSFFK